MTDKNPNELEQEINYIEYSGNPEYVSFIEHQLNAEQKAMKSNLEETIEKEYFSGKPSEDELAKAYNNFVKKETFINETKKKFHQKKFRNKMTHLTPKKKRRR